MIWHSVPGWTQQIFPKRIWSKTEEEETIYLTFDDGPVPGVTDFVLEELGKRKMSATFFVVGDNVQKYPDLARDLTSAGHAVGNHTYHHLNGWRTSTEVYLDNLQRCDGVIGEVLDQKAGIFRPPYGLLRPAQAEAILPDKKIVMWNVLSGDYHPDIQPEQVLSKTSELTKSGAVVVFHDQQKTAAMLKKVLPAYLDFVVDQGLKTQRL